MAAALLAVALLLALASERPAAAATFTVDSTADAVDANPGDGLCASAEGVCTLRAAIQEANALAGPDTITLPAGSYTLTIAEADEDATATGDLDIADDLVITGASAATTIIDGGALDRVLHVVGHIAVTISGVTIRNGQADTGGGVYNPEGQLILTHVTVSDNRAGLGGGGGIASLGSLTLTDSTLSDNTSGGVGGGGIRNEGTATVADSTISDNSSTSAGGIYNCPDSTLVLTNVTISGNEAAFGGGMHNSGPLTMSNVTFTDNVATVIGGALANTDVVVGTDVTMSGNSAPEGGALHNEYNATLTNATISGNTAAVRGGGIYNAGGASALSVTDVTISGNIATNRGGGIHNEGEATLASVSISSNTAAFGGGIYMTGTAHKLSITRSTISGNTAADSGGGIYSPSAASTLSITDSTISGNTSANQGGGIHNSGALTITNSTISGNTSANEPGGGLNLTSLATTTLTNVTITGNRARNGGAIATTSNPTLKNTLLADNAPFNCIGTNTLTSAGHNLDSDGSCRLASPGDLSNVDTLLGPLADNGGPTLTHALLPGSPAIDAAADCPPTDQRGVARPQGAACDIGAYEFEAMPLPIERQLAACLAVTSVAWSHDNQAKEWLGFFPGQPLFLQDLTEFLPGGGYLVNVSADCTISSGTNTITLYVGWNLFGWR